jgi:hypothetical protein
MTQHDRLIKMFREKQTWSNYELRSIQPPMFQYPTRIHELKLKGWSIVSHKDPDDNKKHYYTLTEYHNRLLLAN